MRAYKHTCTDFYAFNNNNKNENRNKQSDIKIDDGKKKERTTCPLSPVVRFSLSD